jgi:hypothetical protein
VDRLVGEDTDEVAKRRALADVDRAGRAVSLDAGPGDRGERLESGVRDRACKSQELVARMNTECG